MKFLEYCSFCHCFYLKVDSVGPDDIVDIRRVSAGRRSRARDVALVLFKTVGDRDTVYRNAPKLADCVNQNNEPSAGLMLEIPEHLLGVFKVLQRHGHQLRSRFGEHFKRHVRMSDEDLSLKLDVRFPKEDEWQTISAEFAMELMHAQKSGAEQKIRERLSHNSGESHYEHNITDFATNRRERPASTSSAGVCVGS